MRAHDPTKFVVSPITGELIPVDQMSEHMRVSMIDPRFQEQRNAMLAKIRDTTKAGDDEISRNLMTLAKKRPDVFGELSGVAGDYVPPARWGSCLGAPTGYILQVP